MTADHVPESESFEPALDGFPIASDSEHEKGRDALEMLASEFADRTRQGLQPAIDDYVERSPELAEQIRDLFPTVAALEQWKLDKEAECLRRNIPSEFPVRQLDEYRLIREIGRGGMGIVFDAEKPSGHHVAVKVLPWRFGASVPRWRERFLKEIATVQQLQHRNIVPVLGCGEQEGYSYYVMPLVNGVSLDHIIRRLSEADGIVYADEIARTLPVDQLTAADLLAAAQSPPSSESGSGTGREHKRLRRDSWQGFARILYQAATAVSYAHHNGVLHNDIKPGNILVDADGRVMVSDFGLARNADAETLDTGESLSGTLRYIAPERLIGQCDDRSDVYSLGVTLYELATLTPAFLEPDHNRLMDRLSQGPTRTPREVNAEIPRDLERIIRTAMAVDPDQRYHSAHAFATDLQRFLNGKSIQGHRRGLLATLKARWRQWFPSRENQ